MRSARKLHVLQNSVELFAPLRVERIHLARRSLLGRDLLHIHEAPLLDADEQRVDGAFDEVREALLAQSRRDLVAVRGSRGQDREHDALESALEHLRHLIAHRSPPIYSVLLTTTRR